MRVIFRSHAKRTKHTTEITTLIKLQKETPSPKIQNALQIARLKLRSMPYFVRKISIEDITNNRRNKKDS